MSQSIETAKIVTFQNNMELMLQQHASLIASVVPSFQASGEKVNIKDFVGAVKVRRGSDRHGDTQYSETPHDKVWLAKPEEAYVADLVDRSDKVAVSIDIGSGYMNSQRDAINRFWDDQALAAIYGNMISGKQGTTISSVAGGMVVPVTTGGASGAQRMNLAKLRQARKVLAQQYNDMSQQRFIVLTAEQQDDLLSEVPATSEDFKQFGGMVNPETGTLTRLLGWNIIEMELANSMLDSSSLSVDGSGYRKNPFWVKDGLVMGEWDKIYTSIDTLPGKRHSTQYYASSIVAATRTQGGKVGWILNSEA